MIELLELGILKKPFIAGILASLACGTIGSLVVVRRMVFISGGISHAAFGGVGLGYLLGLQDPFPVALLFTLAAALCMGLATRKGRLPEDTSIGILWAVGMASGFIFLKFAPYYAPDPMSYLVGDILLVTGSDLIYMIILNGVIILVISLFYREFAAFSFDEEYSAVIGLPVERLYLVLLGLVACAVMMLVKIVGIILLIALLVIPPTIIRRFTSDLRKIMIFGAILGAFLTACGLWISYEFNLPSGPSIILLSASMLLISLKAPRRI